MRKDDHSLPLKAQKSLLCCVTKFACAYMKYPGLLPDLLENAHNLWYIYFLLLRIFCKFAGQQVGRSEKLRRSSDHDPIITIQAPSTIPKKRLPISFSYQILSADVKNPASR
ncbi:MAG: hypothetical protein C4B57_03930 [Deltaproteobacteria bacterium]|nr:MAG: hypothetical protein C4B57_03930 [Deltaproteobacteria bacterium]